MTSCMTLFQRLPHLRVNNAWIPYTDGNFVTKPTNRLVGWRKHLSKDDDFT